MSTLGKILFWSSAAILYFLSVYSYYLWYGLIGGVAGLVIPVLYILYPIAYLVLIGFTPGFLLIAILWLVNLLGVFMMANAKNNKKSEQE
jgi:hypothetical protein